MDTKEILVELIKSNLDEIRHTENHRANITNIILIIVGGVLALLSNDKLDNQTLYVSVFLIFLGLFGVFVTRKLYERQKWYMGRVSDLYGRIDLLDKELKIQELYHNHELRHKRENKFYSKVRMNTLWTAVFLFVVVLGVILLIVSIKN